MPFGVISSTFSHRHCHGLFERAAIIRLLEKRKCTGFEYLALPPDGYRSANPGGLIKARGLGLRHTNTPV